MTRRVRVGILGFFHEANAFVGPYVAARDVMSAQLRGEEIVAQHKGANTVIAGYLEAAGSLGWDAAPLIYFELVPSAPLGEEAEEIVLSRLVDSVRDGDFDVLLLCLHGAARGERYQDLDGQILSAIRDAVPSRTVIVATLDLHANVSDLMLESSDVLVGYLTNPHVDARERAMSAALVASEVMAAPHRPALVETRIPVALGILSQGTESSPMAEFMAAIRHLEQLPGVMSASLFQGFPWGDTVDMGMRIVAYGDDLRLVDNVQRLAEHVWRSRSGFARPAMHPQDALLSASGERTLILDIGDNIGGGAKGTSTVLLGMALELAIPSLIGIIVDPVAATEAINRGVGATDWFSFGFPQLRVKATVLAISDGKYEDTGPTHVGHRYFDAGASVLLDLGSNSHVLLSSVAVMPSSVEQLRSVGTEPGKYNIILAKGVHSPLASYGPYVKTTLFADTSGPTQNDFGTLPYAHRRKPLFPLDQFPSEPDLTPRRHLK